MKGSASWLLPWFLNDGPEHIRDIKRHRHQLYCSPSQHKRRADQVHDRRKEEKAREKEAIQPPALLVSEQQPELRWQKADPLRTRALIHCPPPASRPTKAAHKFLRCPSPALYSSPEPWILQKAGWSYLCPINAHLNLKTLFQQRSLLLLRPEISLDCTGYSGNSSTAKPCCSPTPARPSDRQPFRVPVHQRVPSGS